MYKIHIYTDGAYSSKTQVGGWGIVTVPDDFDRDEPALELHSEYSGWVPNTTNNRMELTAVYEALYYIKSRSDQISSAIIYTDSAYIANAFRDKWYIKWQANGWKTANRTAVLNQDLWNEILSLYDEIKHKTTIEKVNGHQGNFYNEIADTLAVQARTKGAQLYAKRLAAIN